LEYLNKGKYYGIPNKIIKYGDILITDNEYVHSRVDWHYHENAYFTYLLSGSLVEINRKETLNCIPGTLLFHNCQEAHYNIKPEGYTRGFQVEFSSRWLREHGLNSESIEGTGSIASAQLKNIFNSIYIESVFEDEHSQLSIESLLLQFFAEMMRIKDVSVTGKPLWLKRVESILNDHTGSEITLQYLANETGVHPVHISRMFPRYFGANLGMYIRKLRVNKAVELILNTDLSLTQVSAACGFSDQSHFIRNFRSIYRISPLQFKKTIHP